MKVVVVGGGIVGLSMALALGRRGHEVILCERDAAPAPGATEEDVDGVATAGNAPGPARSPLSPPASAARCAGTLPDVLHRARDAGGSGAQHGRRSDRAAKECPRTRIWKCSAAGAP